MNSSTNKKLQTRPHGDLAIDLLRICTNMAMIFLAMVAVASATLPALTAPPVITMSLNTISGSVSEGAVDANGVPCISHAADQVSCDPPLDAGFVRSTTTTGCWMMM